MVPGAVGVTTTSTVAELPLGTSPNSHAISPSCPLAHIPWLGVAETNVVRDGKKSLRPTFWVADSFVTVRVKVRGCPTVAGLGLAVPVMLMPVSVCAWAGPASARKRRLAPRATASKSLKDEDLMKGLLPTIFVTLLVITID
jgi:hypothetical protein